MPSEQSDCWCDDRTMPTCDADCQTIRDRDRAALERIESHGVGYAVGIARAALEGDQ